MDERQFSYLQEMGIPLWVSRAVKKIDAPQESEMPPPMEALQPSPTVEARSVAPLAVGRQPLPEVISEPHFDVDLLTEAPLDWNTLQSVVSQCQRCPELANHRTQSIFGVGNPQADWLIIGEAPAAEEDLQGEPFVGPAGHLLNAMLHAIGLKRSQLYIVNILKCRPPGDRDPKPAEIEACSGYLRRQIALIHPKVILVVGSFAAQSLLKANEPVETLRGKVHQLELPESPELKIPLVVTYHPTYLLGTPAAKAKAWRDLQLARNVFNR